MKSLGEDSRWVTWMESFLFLKETHQIILCYLILFTPEVRFRC